MMIHKVAEIRVKILSREDDAVRIECQEFDLTDAEHPRLAVVRRYALSSGDSVSFDVATDSVTLAEFRRREMRDREGA